VGLCAGLVVAEDEGVPDDTEATEYDDEEEEEEKVEEDEEGGEREDLKVLPGGEVDEGAAVVELELSPEEEVEIIMGSMIEVRWGMTDDRVPHLPLGRVHHSPPPPQ
jgi:hypothetical protein